MPPVCLACREPLAGHDALCPVCWSGVDFIRPPLCDRLGLPMPFDAGGVMVSAAAVADPPPYGRARAVAAYSGQMRELVHALKFNDRHDVRRLFGRWLVEAGKELLADADVVVPVPLSRWRAAAAEVQSGRDPGRRDCTPDGSPLRANRAAPHARHAEPSGSHAQPKAGERRRRVFCPAK